MATRKSNRKKSTKSTNPLQSLGDALLRPGTIGALLVVIAIFTLLSLFSGNNGSVTGAWVGALRGWFGWGAWLVPIVIGVFGGWLVVTAMENGPPPAWRRPLGLFLLFVALITGFSLFLSNEARQLSVLEGTAGGRAGAEIANALSDTITPVGAWALVAFVAVAALIFLTDRLLIDAVGGLTGAAAGGAQSALRRREEDAARRGAIDPQVPLPLGEVSIWARLRERFGQGKQASAQQLDPYALPPATRPPGGPTLVRPEPLPNTATGGTQPVSRVAPSPIPQGQPSLGLLDPAAAAVAAQQAQQQAQLAQKNPAAAPGLELPQPRIFGGAQEWRLPPVEEMLKDWERRTDSDDTIRVQGRLIQDTLALFGVPADFEGAYKGPSVTQYLIKPGYIEKNIKGEQQRIKVKVAKIAGLSNDLALALAAPSVRIEAPIPGTNYVGIEVPNHESNVVGLKELMESESFGAMKGKLKIALGEDVKGQAVSADLARMPHLLIAGATGSGKSVCINSIITCLLLTHTPDTLRLLMVDPKMVELSVYNGVPHLLSPVVTEVDKAAGVLFWAVKEMERRYNLFSKAGARDLTRFNEYLVRKGEKALPYIVVIVDEMADLMMAAPEEVEKHICRLAQMARATGMHLIIATQRPSVDVITGLIKANFPARIAFAVTSGIDSRVILDIPGAERLLGRGDMLFMAPDASKLERLQGTYLGDDEINSVVRYWKGVRVLEAQPQTEGDSTFAPWNGPDSSASGESGGAGNLAIPVKSAPMTTGSVRGAAPQRPPESTASAARTTYDEQPPLFEQIEQMKAVDGRDELFDDAVRTVREAGRGSVTLLQRKLRIGYGRAARLADQLETAGILGPDQGGTAGRALLSPGTPPATQAAPLFPPPPAAGAPAKSAPAQPAPPASQQNKPAAPSTSTPAPTPAPPTNSPAPRIIGGGEENPPAATPKTGIWM